MKLELKYTWNSNSSDPNIVYHEYEKVINSIERKIKVLTIFFRKLCNGMIIYC